MSCPSRINLRDSNPVRGEMFIETDTTKHISLLLNFTPISSNVYFKQVLEKALSFCQQTERSS
jgi:hypothetical protein